MPPNKHQPEEIVVKLRQVDVLLSQGRSVGEAVRSIGVTQFSCVTNSSTAGFSTVSPRRRSSSKLGAAITIPSARTHTWVQAARAPEPVNGRLRYAHQLRWPHRRWCQNPSYTEIQPGPPD
jgi:hypothetical protein